MKISYNKLWKLLIDKNMNKNDLKTATGLSSASIAKLGKCENVERVRLMNLNCNTHITAMDVFCICTKLAACEKLLEK